MRFSGPQEGNKKEEKKMVNNNNNNIKTSNWSKKSRLRLLVWRAHVAIIHLRTYEWYNM